jgi:hypothetical protein
MEENYKVVDIQSITEQIIIKIGDKSIEMHAIFNYVDDNLDIWGIDIGDHFLDDICDIVVKKLKKRVLSTTFVKNSNFIEFKMDEETQEKMMLDKIEKSYNKITRQTINMKSVYENEESDEEPSQEPLDQNSWDQRLERIENIYKKYEETTKTKN